MKQQTEMHVCPKKDMCRVLRFFTCALKASSRIRILLSYIIVLYQDTHTHK